MRRMSTRPGRLTAENIAHNSRSARACVWYWRRSRIYGDCPAVSRRNGKRTGTEVAKRAPKTTRFKIEAARRRVKLERRKRRRRPRELTPIGIAKERRRAVHRYRSLNRILSTEQEAAVRAAREHNTSPNTLRRWNTLHRRGGLRALTPKLGRRQ